MFRNQTRWLGWWSMAAMFAALNNCPTAVAQSIVVMPGNNSTSGNGRAPQGARLFIRTAYYITPGEMAASGFGANAVTKIGWRWNVSSPPAAGAPAAQNVATTGNILIYLQNSTDLGYNKGTSFSAAIAGMTLVANGTITIPAGDAEFTVDVSAGGAGTSAFSTVAGRGVYVVFDYQTTTAVATPQGAPTVFCSNALTNFVNGCATYQSQTAVGNTMSTSTFRPETRFARVVSIDIDNDGDGDVDDDDLAAFVQVLLGLDTTPIHVARSDLHFDGRTDGDDIQRFLNQFFAP